MTPQQRFDIVDNRTDCEGQFNDEFIKEDELDNLW